MTQPDTLSASQLTFLRDARVARLGTVGPGGTPHAVPICFVARFQEDRPVALYSALDEKPKRVATRDLRRVRNLRANPTVTVLVDRYDDTDWSNLAFIRVDGRATLLEPGDAEHALALALLRAKYQQYRRMALEAQPIIRVTPERIGAWNAREPVALTAALPLPPRALPFDELVRGRRSVRHFRPDPVPRAVVERLIEIAGWAPSPHGRQPWRFAVVTRPAVKARLAAAMGAAWLANLALDGQDEATIAARLAGSRRRLTSAPVLVLPCLYTADLDRYPDPARQAAEELMAVQSLGAAVQNLLLGAYDLGLDAGWICAPLFCPAIVRTTLGLASDLVPHAIVPLGYAARDPQRRPRRLVAELLVLYE